MLRESNGVHAYLGSPTDVRFRERVSVQVAERAVVVKAGERHLTCTSRYTPSTLRLAHQQRLLPVAAFMPNR